MDTLGACLDAEKHAKAEAICIKKKLESSISELEIALNHANEANAIGQKAIQRFQGQLFGAIQGLDKQVQSHQEVQKITNTTDAASADTVEEFRDCTQKLFENLEVLKPVKHRPFLHVTTLTNVESYMPFTNEEMEFCLDLKKTKMDAWKNHPIPKDIFEAMLSKQVMNNPQDIALQRSNEVFAERFVVLFNNLNVLKSFEVKDQFRLISANLHFSLILLSANWFHPKHSGLEQVNMYLHGDPNTKSEVTQEYSRFEMEELMPWCSGSHPMHQILKTVMQIDMDETIFLLLVTITLLNSKEIKFLRVQDHMKLRLFRYLKYKSCQAEAIPQFRKIEEVIHALLYSKDFYALLQQ